MYATDRQTSSDVRRASSLHAPYPTGGVIISWISVCCCIDLTGSFYVEFQQRKHPSQVAKLAEMKLSMRAPTPKFYADCPINSMSPFISELHVLLGHTKTVHVILNTIPLGLFRASSLSISHSISHFIQCLTSHYHLFVQHVKTISTYSFWSSNWLVPILIVLWVLHFSSFHSA